MVTLFLTLVSQYISLNIQQNAAVQKAAAEVQYFKQWDEAKFTQAAYALNELFPQYAPGEWLLVLKGLRDSGAIPDPVTGISQTPEPEKENKNYTVYIVIGAILLAFLMIQK